MINHLECHISLIILMVCWHTPLLTVLILSSGNQLRINITEGCRKLPVSAAWHTWSNGQVDLVYLVLVTRPLPLFGVHGLNGQVDLFIWF